MLKDQKLASLYLFYAVYFLSIGITTFAPKYYGDIGLTDGQIGIIFAIGAFISLFIQPLWGMLADRTRYMRSVLVFALIIAGLLCFLVQFFESQFFWLLIILTLYCIFTLPASPVSNAIAIEYTSTHHHNFGPIRMTGTISYQVSILITGFLLSASLKPLYTMTGVLLVLAGFSALALPPVQGKQHESTSVSISVFMKDRAMVILFIVAFLGTIGHQFNLSFFSKFLGDLGMDNATTGIISTLSVILEIPFLLFGDRLLKRMSMWYWLMIGLLLGSIRFIALSFVNTPVSIILAQVLSISQLACFEFFPFIYLGRRTQKELLSSVQSLYQMVSFGLARIVGSLFGGFLADITGIPIVYRCCGILMFLTLIIFIKPMLHMAKNPETSGIENPVSI